ncbi:hypothetical protein HAX54_019271 [Datura stramonium]|uniref:Uncharacterized protein n=1 Tax=Datura stramonium TaxID=4076 RepID=A0ABS8S2D2_DATST|nr:hypothetical protein [Datura stramonium]
MKPRLLERAVARRHDPWFVAVVTHPECLVSESKQRHTERAVLITNGSCSDKSPLRTTMENSKAQEAIAATTSPLQSDEGGDEAKSDGDNPPADNAGKGDDDPAQSGEGDTNAEESSDKDSGAEESIEQEEDFGITLEARSKIWFLQGSRNVYYAGLNLTEKENPSRSIQEEPKIHINALNEVPEHKRIFEGYNMHLMTKTPGKYTIEMVHEFYANYYCTLEKKASSKTTIKKEPVLDSVRVRTILVDISERTITRVLMGGDFTMPTRTTKYDYRMGHNFYSCRKVFLGVINCD